MKLVFAKKISLRLCYIYTVSGKKWDQ